MSWRDRIGMMEIIGILFMVLGFVLFGFVVFSNINYSCTVSNFACNYTSFTVTCTPKHESLIKSLDDISIKVASFVAGAFLSFGFSFLMKGIRTKR